MTFEYLEENERKNEYLRVCKIYFKFCEKSA